MSEENYLKPAKLFYCEECKVFFFSYSQMKKPTHTKCTGHNTRLATNKEIDQINQTNKIKLQYNPKVLAGIEEKI